MERVARGELSPAEAATLLDELETKGPGPGAAADEAGQTDEDDPRDWTAGWEREQQPEQAGSTVSAPPPPPSAEGSVARVRVVRIIGTADIIGDPSVREAVAEGPHVARREGDSLVIEGSDRFDGNGFEFAWGSGLRGRHERHRRRMHRHGGFNWGDMMPVRIRVNPNLALDVDAQASKVRIRGVHGPIRANVQAAGIDIEDFRSPLDLRVQAGNINARGRLDGGASRVHCEAGSVRVHLERGSSARVTARTVLGKVHFDGADSRTPWILGGGEGTLDIDTTMGSVRVTADR